MCGCIATVWKGIKKYDWKLNISLDKIALFKKASSLFWRCAAACGWARDGQSLVLAPEITGARYPFPVMTDISARYGEAAAAQVLLITVTTRDSRTRFNHHPPVTCHAVWQLVDEIDRAAATSPDTCTPWGGVFSNAALPTQHCDRANPKVTFQLWYFLLFRLTSSLTYKKNLSKKSSALPSRHINQTPHFYSSLRSPFLPLKPPPPFLLFFFYFHDKVPPSALLCTPLHAALLCHADASHRLIIHPRSVR